jgi:hypothetical protein
LKHSIDGASGRTGKWSEYEDSELKDAVQLHGGKDWDAIAALVPGRTENGVVIDGMTSIVESNLDPALEYPPTPHQISLWTKRNMKIKQWTDSCPSI